MSISKQPSTINILKQSVESEGLEFFGVVSLAKEESYTYYKDWLLQEKHADMYYLENYQNIRANPAKLFPGAISAVIVGFYYKLGRDKSSLSNEAKVSQYARFKDYHKVLKNKAQQSFVKFIESIGKKTINFRVVVDSAPILEKPLATRCSKGFIGKNTLFIHPQKGSYFLLGEILTDFNLLYDKKKILNPNVRDKEFGGCGSCRRCQIHCPTGALSHDYKLDARKCLSYYTIEHRKTIPVIYWKFLKKSIFGCDICQQVCPYNRKQEVSKNLNYLKLKVLPTLPEIAQMSQKQYEEFFGGTPMTRAKRSGLRRNALIAMIVTNNLKLKEVIELIEKDCDQLLKDTILQITEYKKLL